MSERLFFVSYSLDRLAQAISKKLVIKPFCKILIIVPSKQVSEWLKFEIVKRSDAKSFLGIEFLDWKAAVRKLAKNSICPDANELISYLWNELSEEPHKRLKIVQRLSSLFLEYFWEGFEPSDFQAELFKKWFPTPLEKILSKLVPQEISLFLFGIDSLPRCVDEFFWRHSSVQEFRFSPSAMYWQDIRSPKERNKLIWRLKSQGKETKDLEESFEEDHPLLALWGGWGRRRLEIAGNVLEEDDFEIEDTCKTALHDLQQELLLLEMPVDRLSDQSIRLLQAGASRIKEVELAKELILDAASRGIEFSEMGLYVTDMDAYEPLVEFVFANPIQKIPIRIQGGKSFCKSAYYQGIVSIFRCIETRWSADAVLELFENSSFRKKIGWAEEESLLLKEWVRKGSIRWAIDSIERGKEEGSWEHGIEKIFQGWVFFHPEEEKVISWGEFDSLDLFFKILIRLKELTQNWKEEKAGEQWSFEIGQIALEMLRTEDEDRAAVEVFQNFLSSLKNTSLDSRYPFYFIRRFFDRFIKKDSGGSLLHGVRIMELGKEGAFPADLVILLGLDEESHPRKAALDSLDLRPYSNLKDQDRFSFLKTIFAARQELCFIYRDRSSDDGKEMGPSFILQELIYHLNLFPEKKSPLNFPEIKGFLKPFKVENFEKPPEIALDELIRFFRNPIEYYLDRTLGIDLGEKTPSAWEEFELDSFEWTKLLKDGLVDGQIDLKGSWPVGIFGENALERLRFQLDDWKETLKEYEITPKEIQSIPISFDDIEGSANGSVKKGALYFGVDQIGGYLRRWPELVSILAQTNTNHIISLKGKRSREVKDPQKALGLLKQFYLKYHKSLVPIHPEWIDSLLRKKTALDLDPQDRILKWAIDRSPNWNVAEDFKMWEKDLQDVFAPLIELFPKRKGIDAEI